jgi:hypothetical protein
LVFLLNAVHFMGFGAVAVYRTQVSPPHREEKIGMQDDRWLRYFPRGSLTARPDVHRGQAEYFSLFLHHMGEMPLYPAGLHQPLVIRLLCLPTWSSACCVRIEASGLSWRLVGKEMDGEAGFEVGS